MLTLLITLVLRDSPPTLSIPNKVTSQSGLYCLFTSWTSSLMSRPFVWLLVGGIFVAHEVGGKGQACTAEGPEGQWALEGLDLGGLIFEKEKS